MALNVNPVNKQKHIIRLLKTHIARMEFVFARYKDDESEQELVKSKELLEYLETLWEVINK